MAGKGDKVRPYDKKKFDENFDQIDWTSKISKTFKTSWGAEYTLMLKEDDKNKEDSTPTTEELITKAKNVGKEKV